MGSAFQGDMSPLATELRFFLRFKAVVPIKGLGRSDQCRAVPWMSYWRMAKGERRVKPCYPKPVLLHRVTHFRCILLIT